MKKTFEDWIAQEPGSINNHIHSRNLRLLNGKKFLQGFDSFIHIYLIADYRNIKKFNTAGGFMSYRQGQFTPSGSLFLPQSLWYLIFSYKFVTSIPRTYEKCYKIPEIFFCHLIAEISFQFYLFTYCLLKLAQNNKHVFIALTTKNERIWQCSLSCAMLV